MEQAVAILPHVNAALNSLATILLVVGFLLIKTGHEVAHRRTMVGCFAVSAIFLVCYLSYHQLLHATTGERGKPFGHEGETIRYVYFAILISHVVLAISVPVLAITTIYLGYRDRRAQHRRWAKWTFPIWLYVSVTGVVVYLMLYHFFPE